jgi:hypothetical protein
MKSLGDADRDSHLGPGSAQRPAWQQGSFWVRPTATLLPYFEEEVPLLLGSKGHYMIPVAPLCRLLGLEATTTIHLSRHKLLWSSAELLPIHRQQGGHKPPFIALAWCLDYPLSIGCFRQF